LVRLGAVEVLVMLGTVGLAVALARTPPPGGAVRELSITESLLGYDLAGPPTLARVALDWRFDLIYGAGALVAVALYLAGVRRLRLRGDHWPAGRTVAWLLGCVIVLVATSSGVGRYAPAMFSMHMVSHMLLSMLAPALLVLGGAMTLALRALPVAGGAPGPREWLLALIRSPLVKGLTHPVVALALFVGSFYGLYFSGLFDAALSEHWAHLAMNAHFLLVGYTFYWLVIGIDPAPRRLPPVGRLALVFVSLPFHAFFGIILMSSQTVIGGDFYRALAQGLTWAPDLLADQRLGGGLAWASGELPLLVVLVALLVQWARVDERAARRSDRRADAEGDAELAAYNAMLRDLAGRSEPRS
jgi:putative copper resistance protein D